MKKAMTDVAYELMNAKKKPIIFLKIWEEVSQTMSFNRQQEEDNIAPFYSDLSLDDRFVNVGNNKWDLRKRHRYHDVVIDTEELIIDEDIDEEEEYEEPVKVVEEEF